MVPVKQQTISQNKPNEMVSKKCIFYAATNLLLIFSLCTCEENSKVETAFKSNQIVPDVVSEAPKHKIEVKYGNNKNVDLGNELKPSEVKNMPEVKYEADKDDFYTLIMTDPDAPSRKNPKFREWQHWVITNIPGDDIKKGQTLSEYVGSGPPRGTDLHRYVFLLYKQPKKLEFTEQHLTAQDQRSRPNFSAKKFAEKYGLGQPIAGNFFQAQYEA